MTTSRLHPTFAVLCTILLCGLTAGCASLKFPGVHRINIQQGNVVTQAMIDRLRPGMTKSQVRFVLGNAVIDDSLDQDRWDYIYTLQIRGGERVRRELSLFFIEGRLSHFEGDYRPSDDEEEQPARQDS